MIPIKPTPRGTLAPSLWRCLMLGALLTWPTFAHAHVKWFAPYIVGAPPLAGGAVDRRSSIVRGQGGQLDWAESGVCERRDMAVIKRAPGELQQHVILSTNGARQLEPAGRVVVKGLHKLQRLNGSPARTVTFRRTAQPRAFRALGKPK
ncbi:hypothetical protein [Roseomonas sp. HF4]|uniref:hypothetical protein n=1 Tax=Roseomonas sp. HF4 TaxID=2562313 RepID=UPI0010C1172E|nr:hypothetical protein [Roseomonas sp. HF4]